jgi:hypothetical protein
MPALLKSAKNRHSTFGLIVLGACLLGRKRGIFVLAADAIAEHNSTINILIRDKSSQKMPEERIVTNLQLFANLGSHSGLSVVCRNGPVELKNALAEGLDDFN